MRREPPAINVGHKERCLDAFKRSGKSINGRDRTLEECRAFLSGWTALEELVTFYIPDRY